MTTAVRPSRAAGSGAGRRERFRSTTKPTSALVNATAIHEKLIVNGACRSHCRTVVRLTDTAWYISYAPYAVRTSAPPNTKSRMSQGGRWLDTGPRVWTGDQCRSDWVGMSRRFSGGMAGAGRGSAATLASGEITVSSDT